MGGNIQAQYKLNIKIEKLSYSPGELLNGTFAIDYSKGQEKKKKIHIKKPVVTITIIQTEAIQSSKKATSQNNIISQNINIKELLKLKKNPDEIFSFQIQIPLNTQPSFEWPHSEKINASLRTIIQLEIKEINALGITPLIIRKNSTPLNTPLEIIEKSHKTGMFSSGDIVLKATFQANSYPVYAQVPFQFTADFNQSKYKIKGINYALERKIKMFDSKGKVISEFIDSLMESKAQGNMTKLQTENCIIDIRDPIEIHRKYYMKILEMANGLESNQLITLMPSIKATLFSCEYYVKCRVLTDALFTSSSNSPTLFFPLDIFTPIDNNISKISINSNIDANMEIDAAPNCSLQQQNTPQGFFQGQFPSNVIPPSKPQNPPQQQFSQEYSTPLSKNTHPEMLPQKIPNEIFEKLPIINSSNEQ